MADPTRSALPARNPASGRSGDIERNTNTALRAWGASICLEDDEPTSPQGKASAVDVTIPKFLECLHGAPGCPHFPVVTGTPRTWQEDILSPPRRAESPSWGHCVRNPTACVWARREGLPGKTTERFSRTLPRRVRRPPSAECKTWIGLMKLFDRFDFSIPLPHSPVRATPCEILWAASFVLRQVPDAVSSKPQPRPTGTPADLP